MNNLKWLFQPLALFALAMLLSLNALLYAFWYSPAVDSLSQSHQQLGSSLAKSLAFDSASFLHRNDRIGLSQVLNRYADEPLVYAAAIDALESDLRLQSRTKNLQAKTEPFKFPIYFGNELLGHGEIQLDLSNRNEWIRQAQSSWFLFNITAISLLLALLYWRMNQLQTAWKPFKNDILEHFPELKDNLTGTVEQQLKRFIDHLSEPNNQRGQLLKHLAKDGNQADTERLLEQVKLVGDQGVYLDAALLSIDCQNWAELIRQYDSEALQTLWREYETLMIRVSELYRGVLLADGFSIAFGLNDAEDDFAHHAVCAARVVQLAVSSIASRHQGLLPQFGIALSAGPAFVSKTFKHGIPLPLLEGDADIYLQQVKALQPVNQILMAEPILQYDAVNKSIEANHWRDVTLRNGETLEIWEFDGFKELEPLLTIQANTLVQTNDQERNR